MKEFWNERYSEEEYSYGTEPNVFLQEQLELLPTGKALLPGDGEGRNSVYTAMKGWVTWAFDQSIECRKKARKLAESKGVADRVHYEVCDAMDYNPLQRFDLVASIYFHLPPDTRMKFHRRVVSWLNPGGLYLIEAFRPEQVLNQRNTGGPKSVDLMETEDELRETLLDLEILYIENITLHLAEGRYHDGEADISRFLGRRK